MCVRRTFIFLVCVYALLVSAKLNIKLYGQGSYENVVLCPPLVTIDSVLPCRPDPSMVT